MPPLVVVCLAFFIPMLAPAPAAAQAHAQPVTPQVPAAPADSLPNADEDDHPIEALPPNILRETGKAYSFMQANRLTGPKAIKRGVFTSLYRWSRSVNPINVCFFGGTPAQRRLVVEVASEWTRLGAWVPLHFGSDSEGFATCTGRSDEEHIRVAFVQDGTIWSAVGRESVIDRGKYPRDKPSMNLGYKPTLGAERIRRAILHEFGHALGLEHEHQHPDAKCWPDAFDASALVAWLRRTRGWSDELVRANLELLNRGGSLGIDTTRFDPQAVMIYGFPARFYKKLDESHCYADETAKISEAESKLMVQLYPPRIELAQALETERQSYWRQQLGTPRVRGGRGPTQSERELIRAYLQP